MAKLIFENIQQTFELENGSSLVEACEEAGVPIACTEGVCGTCVIRILKGKENLSPPTEEEKDFLGDGVENERLACQCKIMKGEVIASF